MSIARSMSRRADCKKLPFRTGSGIVKATHANKGYAVILDVSKAVGKFDIPQVVLSGTTAGAKILGELCDVHDDGTCSVEVRDMLFRADAAYGAADNGGVLGTHTVAGTTAVSSALDDGPIVYGGFTEDSVNYFRAARLP